MSPTDHAGLSSTRSVRLPRVLLVKGQEGPSYTLAAKVPFAALQAAGHCELREANLHDPDEGVYWCDSVIVIRGHTPSAVHLALMAKHLRRFLAVYWDDNIFEIPRFAPESPLAKPCSQKNVVRILDAADLLMVSNPRLIPHLRASSGATAPAVVLRAPALGLLKELPLTGRQETPPIVGYGGHLGHARQLQTFVVPALDMLQRQGVHFQFHVIGPQLDLSPNLAAITVHRNLMSQEEWVQFRNRSGWTVALAPLPKSPFHECKYYNKFVEYAAGGIPCIFSNVPPYADVIEHRSTGLLVENTPRAWAEAIGEMLGDDALRERIRRASWEYVSRNHSLPVIMENYRTFLATVLVIRQPPQNSTWLKWRYKGARWFYRGISRTKNLLNYQR